MSDAPTYESRLPEWQRWLNQFCENWIFAFLVAMAIRHFCLEAFRIPTASMEPMLYGDPGLLKGDHVVVDKLTPRFTGYTRWDVTVFQFPRPELEAGDDARPALSATGDRLDDPLLRPLFCRNFVKRLVAVPGDTFFIAGGNLHLKQPDGTWQVARKPARMQEALWQDIYIQGDQPGYLPWAASGTSAVQARGDGLALTLGDQPVTFIQPLRNLYVKPGRVRVTHLPAAQGDKGDLVEVAMTRPVFTARGQQGNLWDLDSWQVERLTAKDLDAAHGTVLNGIMDEWEGDLQLLATPTALDGTAIIRFQQGTAHAYDLQLAKDGWRVLGDGAVLGSGTQPVLGHELRFALIDAQVQFTLDGATVLQAIVPDVDPSLQRVRLSLTGTGRLDLGGVSLRRDLHYSAKGFLANEATAWGQFEQAKNGGDALTAAKAAENQRLIELVRREMHGGQELTGRQSKEPWGYSPETAVTVPSGCYLLLGDNSPHSWDGRYWGWVPEENLRGRALAVMFPPQRWRIVR